MTRLHFLILFLWASVALTALDPARSITQYNVQVWDMEAGLPGNSVLAVCQTQEGYLWIGTQDGLVRFDGLNFELFNSINTPSLTNNVIRALYRDRNGTLWIGTSSGGLIAYNEGKFTAYPISAYENLHRISSISGDRWGNLWIGSVTKGLTCLRNGKFTTYTTKQGLPDNRVGAVYKDGNGDIWVTTAGGIVKITKPGNFRVYAPKSRLPYFKTVCLYDKDTGALWIGTGKGGLFRLKNDVISQYGVDVGIPQRPITCLYRDRMKNLWIGTDGGGLIRMSNGTFSTLRGGDGLTNGFVSSIIEDREGSLWVGTLDGGLHQLRNGKFTTYTTREGLAHDYAYCIHEARSGGLWVGTKGGLCVLGSKPAKPFPFTGLFNSVVSDVYEDPSGSLWIGTWTGLHRFTKDKHTVITKKNGLSDNRISCIVGDRHGNTWIGTLHGLNRIEAGNGRLTVFTKAAGPSGNIIQFILEDSKGNLWVGTDTGLNTLKDGVLTAYNLKSAAGEKVFRCAYEDNRGVFWFGTDSGLIRMVSSESIYICNVQKGLIEADIYSILEDNNGYLWLAGRNGISRVRKKELEDFSLGKIIKIQPEFYNEKDGMKSRWCTGSACKTRDGKFWFPTSVGVATIDPNHIKKNPIPPPLMIEKIIVDGETIHMKRSPLFAEGGLEIAPGIKRLEFYYTALSFINPLKIRFKIKLAGYDKDWLDIGTDRHTTYTGLSPGHYNFRVTACNPDRVWNKKGVSFSFYVKPHWYNTWWAFVLYVLFAFFGMFLFVSWRSEKLKREKQRLEQMVKERTVEINEKSLQLHEQSEKLKEVDQVKSRFFANISHEFRTPLTLIMGPLEQRLSICEDKQQQRELKMMLRNSRRLLNLINQLLDLSKFDSGKMKLQAVRQDIVPFLKGIVHSFDSLTKQNEQVLTFQSREEAIFLYYDAEKIENVVINLLINAVKFTPPGGEISVILSVHGEPSPGFLEILFRDTGIGIPVEQLDHIFDRFYQAEDLAVQGQKGSGIGLALAKEIVTLHHGEILGRSEQGRGSEFIIHLPLGDSHLKPGEIAKRPVKIPGHKALRDILDISAAAEEEDAEETPETAGSTRKDIILLVEDNADVRNYIRGPLRSLYRVEEAVDGEEGIKKAKKIIPDLIISDIMMPGIDGYGLCKALKTDIKTSHIPIIMLTAKASEESVLQGLETGADDYITKPFSTKILSARIKNLIELRRQLQRKIQDEMVLQPGDISVSSLDREFIENLRDIIEKNLSDPELTVEQMTKRLYMSQSSLYRKVEALTGQSPRLFIRSYRLKRAAQLLKSNFGNITEVAFAVGFSSTSYFTRCFKERFHCLPSDYKAG